MANTCKVLEKVNAARVAAGLSYLDSLPKGVKGSSKDCPLARALRPLDGADGVSVGGTTASGINPAHGEKIAFAMGGSYNRDTRTLALPGELRRFVADFDGGAHPELITYS